MRAHTDELIATVNTFEACEGDVHTRLRDVEAALLANSKYLRQPNFVAIHPADLAFLFTAYDERFLARRCRNALDGRKLTFRLASRLTRADGKTTRFRSPAGETGCESAVATSILFDGFTGTDRGVTVCGIPRHNRLHALQRIFEHEFVHLVEQICWENSDCSTDRFQNIARRLFLHRAHTHDLITRNERAAVSGIRIRSQVTFLFEDRCLTGRVNRITKRATILIEDPAAPGNLVAATLVCGGGRHPATGCELGRAC